MRKRIASLAIALGVAGALAPFGSAAHADEPLACFGQPTVPASYWCLIRAQIPVPVPCGDCGPIPVEIDETCVVNCFGPFDLGRPGIDAYRGELLVYYYDGDCYYIYGDRHPEKNPAADAPNCP